MENYEIIGYALFLGTLFVGGAIIASKLVGFQTPHIGKKYQPYECSEDPYGNARIQFMLGFYIFALLFLIFDVESLFLFPCMSVFKELATTAVGSLTPTMLITELGVFILILVCGLVYAWRKEVLIWQ